MLALGNIPLAGACGRLQPRGFRACRHGRRRLIVKNMTRQSGGDPSEGAPCYVTLIFPGRISSSCSWPIVNHKSVRDEHLSKLPKIFHVVLSEG